MTKEEKLQKYVEKLSEAESIEFRQKLDYLVLNVINIPDWESKQREVQEAQIINHPPLIDRACEQLGLTDDIDAKQ